MFDALRLSPALRIGNRDRWPIFNVADASISLGVAFLALIMWFEARAERQQSASNSTLPPVDIGEAS